MMVSEKLCMLGNGQYVGSPARQQLVRNAANTLVGFRPLLGKSCVLLGLTICVP